MPDIEAIKTAIIQQHQKSLPLMDVEKIRQEFLEWLRQLRCPVGSNGTSWGDSLRVYPPEEGDKLLDSGVRIRLALTLRTAGNSYVLSILECLAPDSREVYILCAHVNWQEGEKRLQKSLDEVYAGSFEDVLRARHTIWAQTFRESELAGALNSCALAVLGHELVADRLALDPSLSESPDAKNLPHNDLTKPDGDHKGPRVVTRPLLPMKDFPSRDEDSLL